MPRLARKKFATSFFHVMSQGIAKEKILRNQKMKEKYFDILLKELDKSNMILVAYCMMDNHVHLLFYTQNSEELSKLMQHINSKYAIYYNKINNERVGYVFRNRFLSEGINTQKYLNNCIKYIHQNPVKAGIVEKCKDYKYSSYNDYRKKDGLYKKLGNTLKYISSNISTDTTIMDGFLETEINASDVIRNKTKEFEEEISMNINEILEIKEIFAILIKEIKKCYKIKNKDIKEYFKITDWKWKKIMK